MIKKVFLGVALILAISAIWVPGSTMFLIQAAIALIVVSCLIKGD